MTAPAGLIGDVPGGDAPERAARVAGALAELGARRLVFRDSGGQEQALEPRRTDLPGLLAGAGPGSVLECTDLGLSLGVLTGAIRWRARDQAGADAFRAALATSSG